MMGHPMEYCYYPAMGALYHLIQLLCSTSILGLKTGWLLYKFMGRVPGCWDTQWNTVIIPPWCGRYTLIQLLCSTDMLGRA